ncbi:gluconokinase [Penicillium taxi]|uniref:gluconokinase n=1 Tax=Penicillium taxi TaxID=168475 RepID=UPI002545307A|nr:gluconokinase [Penicillium taxi]KAJ5902750.1 gluconokinase [Penicillium taxi]
MLSTGERPQLPMIPSVVDSTILSREQAHIKSNLQSNATFTTTTQNPVVATQHIWVVTGPAGCGKSTVGQALHQKLGVPFLEGDDFHPISNKEKMSNGNPLTDEDRWDWLISLRNAAIEALSPSESNNFHPPAGVVVSCSALKRKYRDVIRVAAYGSPSVQIHFIYLKLTEAELLRRVSQRQSHYMKSDMVRSQITALEEPQSEWDAITINVENSQEHVKQQVFDAVAAKIAEASYKA